MQAAHLPQVLSKGHTWLTIMGTTKSPQDGSAAHYSSTAAEPAVQFIPGPQPAALVYSAQRSPAAASAGLHTLLIIMDATGPPRSPRKGCEKNSSKLMRSTGFLFSKL